jgi:hypothetical protein
VPTGILDATRLQIPAASAADSTSQELSHAVDSSTHVELLITVNFVVLLPGGDPQVHEAARADEHPCDKHVQIVADYLGSEAEF